MRDRVTLWRWKWHGEWGEWSRWTTGDPDENDPEVHAIESDTFVRESELVSNREALAAELERRAASVSKPGVAHGLTEAAQLVRDFDTEEGK